MRGRLDPSQATPPGWDAVILAGGRASRLGGVVKPLVEVRGRPLLEAALASVRGAQNVVVVGDVPVPPGVQRTIEDPPYGGPAAGLAAAMAVLEGASRWTVVLASDLPEVELAVPDLLAMAAASEDDASVDGVCFHDEHHHPQWLLAIYRTEALRRVLGAGETRDVSMRRLLAPLHLITIPGDRAALADCDTWSDIEAANASQEDT